MYKSIKQLLIDNFSVSESDAIHIILFAYLQKAIKKQITLAYSITEQEWEDERLLSILAKETASAYKYIVEREKKLKLEDMEEYQNFNFFIYPSLNEELVRKTFYLRIDTKNLFNEKEE